MINLDELTGMSVEELRDYARKNTPIKKTAIVFLKKGELIHAILNPSEPLPGFQSPAAVPDTPPVDLATMLAEALQGKITAGLDENRVRDIIAEAFEASESITTEMVAAMIEAAQKNAVKTIEVKRHDGSTKAVGFQHYIFSDVLASISADIPIMLVGPAGSGKTHLVKSVADALGLRFIPQSVTAQTSISSLMGYMSASGIYINSPFRDAYENGGLFLLDEIDAGNANVLSALNAATSNGVCLFPDNVLVHKHNDFRVAAGANTYGNGANRSYIGRNPMDGATKDRFSIVDMPYDEALERALCENQAWCDTVQRYRHAVDELTDIKHIISPRATFSGEKLLAAGLPVSKVMDMTIWKGLNIDTQSRIESVAGRNR
jgi:MoxR-like ATPase